MTATPASPRLPTAVQALIIVSWLLGWLLVLDGLGQRLTNTYPLAGLGLWPWMAWAQAGGWGPADTGWLLLSVGSGLLGASFGLYAGRAWGYAVAGASAGLALAYAVPGTLLALICLALWALPATRRHIRPPAG